MSRTEPVRRPERRGRRDAGAGAAGRAERTWRRAVLDDELDARRRTAAPPVTGQRLF